MPCNAEFCVGLSAFYGIVFFLLITTLFAKYFKMVQFNAMCSSQIVVSYRGQTTDGGVHYLTKEILIPILHCLHTFQLELFFLQ